MSVSAGVTALSFSWRLLTDGREEPVVELAVRAQVGAVSDDLFSATCYLPAEETGRLKSWATRLTTGGELRIDRSTYFPTAALQGVMEKFLDPLTLVLELRELEASWASIHACLRGVPHLRGGSRGQGHLSRTVENFSRRVKL